MSDEIPSEEVAVGAPCTGLGMECIASAYVERADGITLMPGMLVDLSQLGPAVVGHKVTVSGTVECYDKDGNLKWRDTLKGEGRQFR